MSYAGPTPRGKQLPPSHSTSEQFSASRATAASTGIGSARRSYDPRLGARASTEPRRRGWENMTVFAAGIAVGLAIGVGTTLLFAPQTGEETRYAIARRAQRIRRRGGDAWEDLRRELKRAAKRRLRSIKQAVRRKDDAEER